MRRGWARGLAGVALAVAVGIGACRYLLPERLAVNAPLAHILFGSGRTPPDDSAFGSRIRVPDGFGVGLFAEVPSARFLRFSEAGDLLVSVPRDGRVLRLLRDADGDGRSDGQETLLEDLNRNPAVSYLAKVSNSEKTEKEEH